MDVKETLLCFPSPTQNVAKVSLHLEKEKGIVFFSFVLGRETKKDGELWNGSRGGGGGEDDVISDVGGRGGWRVGFTFDIGESCCSEEVYRGPLQQTHETHPTT